MAPGCTWTAAEESPDAEAAHLALHHQPGMAANQGREAPTTTEEAAREIVRAEVDNYIEIGYRTMVAGMRADSTSLPAVEQMRHLHLAEPHLPAFASVERLAAAGLRGRQRR
jgi:hypothetical protein